ncbi:MAG: hypothetical protein EOP39_04330 [Rubrivivax sp.]|nr:MAG: hypothetical protein EOP39_04330 [Rubrivivax sp.]
MQQPDIPKFLEILAGVHDFYGKELSDFSGQVWIEAMKPFDLEQVTKALSAHVVNTERGQFMPKPSEVVKQLQGTQTDRALIAWGKVSAALSDVGAYSDVVFDDPLIHLCVTDHGGWPKFCRTTYEEQSYLQHRFCESYRAYASRGVPTDYPARLTGVGSGADDYAKRGMQPPKPRLVGDRAAALRVLSGGSAVRQIAAQVVAALPLAMTGEAA